MLHEFMDSMWFQQIQDKEIYKGGEVREGGGEGIDREIWRERNRVLIVRVYD